MPRHRFGSLLRVLLFILVGTMLSAQQPKTTTSVTIVVTDESGAAVSGALIKLLPLPDTAQKKLGTDSNGRLSLDLKAGSYDLFVSSPGFRSVTQQIQVQESGSQTVSVALHVGGCPPGCLPVVGLAEQKATNILSVGAQASSGPQGEQPAIVAKNPFSIVISAPNQATKLGSPILVKYTITNTTDHDVIFPAEALEDLGASLHIDVRDSQGNEASFRKPHAPLSNPPKFEELPLGGHRGIFLGPGASHVSG